MGSESQVELGVEGEADVRQVYSFWAVLIFEVELHVICRWLGEGRKLY